MNIIFLLSFKFDIIAADGLARQSSIHLVLTEYFDFNTCGRFYKHGLTLIPAWISNYTHYNVWD